MVSVSREIWGRIDGNDVARYILSEDELSVSLISFGASVQRIVYRGLDMVISLPEPELYRKYAMACFGAVVGRYAGRIAGGRFSIDGREYRLTRNEKGNHLHGGKHGFGTRLWESRTTGDPADGVTFSLLSPDGDEGYPGEMNVSVTYRVTSGHCLGISYEAFSSRDTVINLTNHCYFNPNGVIPPSPGRQNADSLPDNRDIEMTILADSVVELSGGLPTGRLLPVEGTGFDFRSPRKLARDRDISSPEDDSGFDHTFVFLPHEPEQPVAVAAGLRSGVRISCYTDQPGAQLFTLGNPGSVFAFETQHFPDSPHHPEFPDTVLRAGDIFRSETVYQFS